MRKRPSQRMTINTVFRWLLILLVAGLTAGAQAQRVESLSQVKTLSVEAFSGGSKAKELHDSLVRQLSRGNRFHLVQSPKEADAILKGTGQIWVRGYVVINPRTPATDRQAVYGGFLSLELDDSAGQALWSSIVTPSRAVWSNIVDNLAHHAARELIGAAIFRPASPSSPSHSGALAQTTLTGAGATFPAPLYQKWFEDFEHLHPGVSLRYSPIGSQLGMETLLSGQLDFAGSDVAPEVPNGTISASDLHRIATVVGAVVPIYNLKGVTRDLRFTPETLAGIYLGRVRRWNDPQIQTSNKSVHLPEAEIAVVHRSDGSGTTWVWSDFLSKVSTTWSSSVGRGTLLHWPAGSGAEYSEGVANAVEQTPNSIGYVELTYAIQHQLNFAAVRNSSGEYIHADLNNLAAAADTSGAAGESVPSITNSSGKYAYPIAAFTWLLIPPHSADPAKRAALAELLRWILTSGQNECSELGYVPLPRATAEQQLRILNSLQ